ncbi:MAG TPA: hypothetical protein VI199_10030, partial [Novosphingobium sp.]
MGGGSQNPVAAGAEIAMQIGLGAITYVGVHLALWHVARRPAGVETEVLGLLRDWRTGRTEASEAALT